MSDLRDFLKWLEHVTARMPSIEEDFDEGYQQAYVEVREEVRRRLMKGREA